MLIKTVILRTAETLFTEIHIYQHYYTQPEKSGKSKHY
jgi:hypothetical protein